MHIPLLLTSLALAAAPQPQQRAPSPQISSPCQVLSADPRRQAALEAYRRWRVGPHAPGRATRALTEGDKKTFKVYNFQTFEHDDVPATLHAVGQVSYVWMADSLLAEGLITDAALAELEDALETRTPTGSYDSDQGIISIERGLFGDAPNVDGSGRVHALIVDIKDSWEEGCGCGFTAGFFDPLDLSPTDPDSNHADLLYIDAYPGMAREGQEASAAGVLGTLAHEHQHLLHASYGQLSLFQNEGQSEWATALTGFGSRNMAYLSLPSELGTELMSWRYGDAAYDYQRAGLFHRYLASRVGVSAAAAITRAETPGIAAYETALTPAGLSWEEGLLDFHLASWVNDAAIAPQWAHSDGSVGVLRPTLAHITGDAAPPTERALEAGAVDYLQWSGAQDLSVQFDADAPLLRAAVLRPEGSSTARVEAIVGDTFTAEGAYESVVIAVTNPTDSTATSAHSATWTPTGNSEELLSHYDPGHLSYFVALPRTDDQTRQAVRLSPIVTGELREVIIGLHRFLDGSPNPVGNGTLRVSLASSERAEGLGAEAVLIPGAVRASMDIPLETLGPGLRRLPTEGIGWRVNAGEDLQLIFEVIPEGGEATIYVDLDSGSDDTAHPDYYPARTRRWDEATQSWDLTWANNGNIVALARVYGEVRATPGAPSPRYPTTATSDAPLPIRLAWYPQSGAALYDVQLADEETFASPLFSAEGVTTTEIGAPELALGSVWYWRVRGVGAGGKGPWSRPEAFNVKGLSEGGETLSYINPEEILWAVTLPYGDETRWATRFTPYMEGQIDSLRLDLADLEGLTNPEGEGQLRISLHDSTWASGEGPDTLYVPGAELGVIEVDLSTLSPGPNTVDLSAEGWQASPLDDRFIVIEIVGDGAVTLDLDNGTVDTVDVSYHPARTLRYSEGDDSWAGRWLGNGNIGLALTLGEAPSSPQTLSYFEPTTLFWYVSLPFGEETAWATRLSPDADLVLSAAELGVTSFVDGSANPTGSGSLVIKLTRSEEIEGDDGQIWQAPGAELAQVAIPLEDVDTAPIPLPDWPVSGGQDYHLIVMIDGEGSMSLNLDDGSTDLSDDRYYPPRTLRFFEGDGSWNHTFLGNGNTQITVTGLPAEDIPPAGCGERGTSPLPLLGLFIWPICHFRRRRSADT